MYGPPSQRGAVRGGGGGDRGRDNGYGRGGYGRRSASPEQRYGMRPTPMDSGYSSYGAPPPAMVSNDYYRPEGSRDGGYGGGRGGGGGGNERGGRSDRGCKLVSFFFLSPISSIATHHYSQRGCYDTIRDGIRASNWSTRDGQKSKTR
jgi:hypothetical protein